MIDPKKDPIGYATRVVGGDPFATLLGIEIDEVRDSYARVSLTIKDEYCNAKARTHGGALFTLADQAFAVAINSRGHTAFGLEMKINYFEASRPGERITAIATPVDIRRKVSLWSIELRNEKSELIAAAQGMAYHFVREKQ
jgi:acyl-CoA thioesterase